MPNLIPSTGSDKAALMFWRERASSLQTSEETLKPEEARCLPMAIKAAEFQLIPTTPQHLAVEVKNLKTWAEAFNVPATELTAVTRFYMESLSHLPPDVLTEAFKGIRATHKWGMRLPLPAEILAHAEPTMADRRHILAKLQIAKRCPIEMPQTAKAYRDMTDQEKKEFDDMMDRLRGRFPTQRAADDQS